MKKTILWILLIFLVPLAAYYGLSKDKASSLPAVAATAGDEVIKFASPMCYECLELQKVIHDVFPKYYEKVSLQQIDVTKRDKNVQALIKEYGIRVVPTTVFKNQDGRIIRRVEGTMQPEIFEKYLAELINE